jgi:anti-anti-sigma regulatory factor
MQLGRDYLGFTTGLEVHLEGVLDEDLAHPLGERIDTLVRSTDSDVLVDFGDLTTVTRKGVQRLLAGTCKTFEQRRVRLIVQEVDASLCASLRRLPVPSYVTVIQRKFETTATGD